MVANQILASGGMWLNLGGTEILLDPGPGCIVQATKRRLRADKLAAIILSHRHLDHSGDLNIMIEAMTQGGFKPRGRLYLPADALSGEPVVFSYLKKYLDAIDPLEAGLSYSLNNVTFTTPVRHIHPVETYGFIFQTPDYRFSVITDTRYFDGLPESYSGELLVINTVFFEDRPQIDHLSVADTQRIITAIKPETVILTHFGIPMWRARPWEVAERLTEETGVQVISARDGMRFDLTPLKRPAA